MSYYLSLIKLINRNIVLLLASFILIGCGGAALLLAAGSGATAGVATGVPVTLATTIAEVVPAAILPFTAELNRAVVAPDGSRLYAVDRLHNTLNVYDIAARRLLKVIDIPELEVSPTSVTNVLPYLAISPDGSKLYVACSGVKTLAIIDTATLQVAGSVPNIGTNLVAMNVSKDNSQVFVADSGGRVISISVNTLQISDLSMLANEVGGDGITFNSPASIVQSPDGRYLYVADRGSDSLVRINLSTFQGRKVTVGDGPAGVAVTPDGGMILVSNSASNTISLINSGTLNVSTLDNPGVKDKEKPGFALTSPDGRWAFVANIGTGENDKCENSLNGVGKSRSLSVIDLKTQQLLPGGPLAIDSEITGMAIYSYQDEKQGINIQKAYLTASCPNGVLHDPASINRVSAIDMTLLSSNPGQAVTPIGIQGKKSALALAIKPDGSELYVVHADAITVIDTHSPQQQQTSIAARGAGPFGLDVGQGVLVTANAGSKSASFVDTATLTHLETIPVSSAPATVVAASNGKAYVANTGTFLTPGKSISVINLATRLKEQELTSALLTAPFSLAMTPNGKKLVAGYAGQFTELTAINVGKGGVSIFDSASVIKIENGQISRVNKVIAPTNNFIFTVSYNDGVNVLYSNINQANPPLTNSLFSIANTGTKPQNPVDIDYHPINATTGKVVVLDYVGRRTGDNLGNIFFSGASVSIFDVVLDNSGNIANVTLVNPNPILIANHAATAMLMAGSGSNLRVFIVNSGDKQYRQCTGVDGKVKSCGTGSSVTVVDVTTGTVKKTIQSVGEKPLDIVQANGKAYVPAYFSDHVAVINLTSETLEKTIKVGRGPVKAVVDDKGMVYVANSIDGTVTVINSLTDEVVRSALAVNP